MLFGFTPLEIAVIVLISFAICTLATSLAMESAALFVPAFLLLFPVLIPTFPTISANEAIGLTLVIMFFGQTSTVIGYWWRNQIRFRLAATVIVVSVPFAVVGRVVSYAIPDVWLLLIFAAVLFVLAVVIHRSLASSPYSTGLTTDGADETSNQSSTLPTLPSDRLSFASGGMIAGMVGFAIGEVSNTRLHVNNGVPIRISIGTSTVVLYLTILTANVVNILVLYAGWFGSEGTINVPWAVAFIVAPVVLVGGQAGAFLNSRLPETLTVRLLVGTYVAVGLITLTRVFV